MAKSNLETHSDKYRIFYFLLLFPLFVLAILNLLTVFTPEIGFDALWYHLTLPKLWLIKHQWYFPGGLLYYSVMPRLAETIFIPLIQITGSVGPKFVQYLSGLGTCFFIWKILSHYKQTPLIRMVGVSLFYCTWLVSWQSGSAYIDLIRTFLETSALFYIIKKSWKMSGVFLGLAIGTKWIALCSLAIFSLVFGLPVIFPALLISLPWFILAFHYTGNPIYPIFSGVLNNSFLSIGSILKNLVFSPYYFTFPHDDFVSPLAGLVFILALFSLTRKDHKANKIALFGVFGALFSLLLDPPSSRFFLPYLPALIIATLVYLDSLSAKLPKNIFVALAICSGFLVLGLRLVAVRKYYPLITQQIDEKTFLANYASRLPGTFVDTDNYVKNLPTGSKILVDKLHNLYYFPRDFDHTSWVKDTSDYDFLVTIGENPKSVAGNLIHTNNIGVQIFKLK